jgi:hemolysin activation/secretion protein
MTRRPVYALLVLAALVFLTAPVPQARAQVAPPATSPREPLPAPEPGRPPPAPEFTLPPFVQPEPGRLSSALRVRVTRFRITGNTVFGEDELRAQIAQFEGREIGSEELEEARRRVTAFYIGKGYINSGALIPDQQVEGGVIHLQVIEGRLTEVRVASDARFAPDYIRGRVAPPAGEPLNVVPLQERIQVLLANPRIERVNAELGPGERAGEAILRLDVKEAPPYEIGFVYANNRSPSIGGYYAGVKGAAHNLFGRGVGLSFRAGFTDGLDEAALALAVPVTPQDTVVSLRVEKNRALVVEQPFRDVGIVSRFDTLELGVSHPFYKTVQQEFALGAYYATRTNATFLLGESFPFVPGLADGRSKVRSLRFSADWLERSEVQVFAARAWIKFGLTGGGATVNPGFPDSNFVARFAQLQWVRRLSDIGNQLVMRFDAQESNGALLPSEKFAIGGMDSVRGYRENRLVKDRGWVGSAEYRHPVGRWLPENFSERAEDGQIQLAAFIDAGRAVDDQDTSPGRRVLASAGVGLRWDLNAVSQLRLYIAKPLLKVDTATPTLQDRGVHFSVAIGTFF